MHPHILQTISLPIIVIVSVITSHLPISLCVTDERYLSCSSSFECGNIQGITYPFWGMDRPAYCGHPGFHLDCSGDAPVITISELAYRVFEFNHMSQTLKVARTEHTQNVCSIFPVNSTLDPNLFSYASNTKNLTLYYGCPTIPSQFLQTTGLFDQFICDVNRTTMVGYYLTRNLNTFALHSYAANISSYLKLCNNSIILPASQSALRSMERRPAIESLNFVLDQGFELQWTANDSLCDECKRSGGQCGYSTNASKFTCYCQDRPYATSCEKGSSDEISLAHKIVRVVSFAIYTMIAVTIIILCSRRGFYRGRTTSFWGKKANHDINISTIIMNFDSLTPKQYTYSDIKKMTNSFIDKLGQGGFGGVYKGELPDGRPVAVEVLKNSKGDGKDFINEVASISRTSHVNIVTLLGFCYERTKRALIYEYMPNGSLDKFIYGQASLHANHHLERKTLYEISIGIARGLEYLHRGCNTRIVHFDIKPHNILLDRDLCPKISDFGLAKLCKREESKVSVTGARGTAGYIAPEVFCRNFGGVSYKSDVYSYGMMVLEMVGGRKNIDDEASQSSEIYFPDSIYEHLESGEISGHDRITTDEEEETVRKMVMVGLWCVQTNPSDRPSMTKVVEMLEGSLQFLQTPPKPFLYSPTRSPDMQIYSTSSTLCTFQQRDEDRDHVTR